MRQLIADGYNVNETDSKLYQEYSPLHWAAMRGCREVGALLLEHSADTTLVDLRNNTARQLAEKQKDRQFLALFDQYEGAAAERAGMRTSRTSPSRFARPG